MGKKHSVAIATLVDKHMWLAAAVFVHQLARLNTTLPIVVFNVTELPQPAVTLIESLGARVTSLEPSITVPEEFHSHLLQWPFSTKRGATVMRRFAPYAKLGVWGQTQWSKVVLVDVDVVFAANIDEMAAMPANTFSPETCNSLDPARCTNGSGAATQGFNAGVMVIGPSAERFASMNDFATDVIGQQLRRYNYSTKQARAVENNYLAYPEQSFLKRYWPKVMRATIEGGGRARMGYDWQWRTIDPHEACARGGEEAECQPSHFMSRLYNARPYDCSTCSADYVTKVKIVHYTCGPKPWGYPRAHLQRCAANSSRCTGMAPCLADWTMRWYVARDEVCRAWQTNVRLQLPDGCV
mmetsp:Transcript_12640/g.29731  ORF Transcript_12640/g.29731 Transcript_12640/m.29731 type:complete len:354 (-) Transcript_12640:113-1174(-)